MRFEVPASGKHKPLALWGAPENVEQFPEPNHNVISVDSYQVNFSANWICRDDVFISVIAPAAALA